MKGEIGLRFSEPFRSGIEQHRRLDSFAAGNRHFLSSRRRLDPRFSHWRGILVDVFYDHFLTLEWDAACSVPLPDLLRRAEGEILQHRSILPDEAFPLLMRLLHDWIPTYGTVEGIGLVLSRMSGRIRRPNPLSEGIPELELHYGELLEDFRLFLADVLRLAPR